MIGRRSPRPLRPARRLTTIGATIAMAMTLPVAAGAPMASAEPRPDLAELTPMIAANGSISTFGGCNSGIPFLIRSCTEAETITTGYPMQLRMRPEGHHIVVLGYGLQENGALRAELIRRLTSARDMADTYPETTLIVTGGAPRNGVTEASAMKEWLVDNGIDEDRVIEEDKSGNTVQNAQLTSIILAEHRTTGVTLVTSRDHLQRALINFREAALARWIVSGTSAEHIDVEEPPGELVEPSGAKVTADDVRDSDPGPATGTGGDDAPLPSHTPDATREDPAR